MVSDPPRLLLALLLAVAGAAQPATARHLLSGGDTSIEIPPEDSDSRGAFSRPAANLSMVRMGDLFAGNSFFQNAWVSAPASVGARDGLGPLFNTRSCQSCHIRDGRGHPPEGDDELLSMLVRLSVPSSGSPEHLEALRRYGVVPEPTYGTQLQSAALPGIALEGKPRLEWEAVAGAFDDGTPYSLRRPVLVVDEPGYGPLAEDLQTSIRVAPILPGIGLLDTIPEETLEVLSDPDDADGDGISGRINRVWDVERRALAAGRFGWKTEQPTARQQVASAFVGDVGITSSLFPDDHLTATQREFVDAPDGGSPEVDDRILDLDSFYSKTLSVPARRGHDDPLVLEGEELFRDAGCHTRRVPSITTGDDPDFPELSGQQIHPYTDLPLHDMGPGLADGRPSFEAGGSDWRTAPLWGIGMVQLVNQHTDFLHHGRARNLEEAILWHGGEAASARDRYEAFTAEQRRKLIGLLRGL